MMSYLFVIPVLLYTIRLIFNLIVNKLVFTPTKINNKMFLDLNYENVDFTSELITIDSCKCYNLFLNKITPKRSFTKYVIFSHGTSSNIYFLHDFIKRLTIELNICTVSYDYCGYGLSTGKSSEDNCYKNHDDVVDYVIKEYKVDQKNIILIGRSLGTGVVINYVSNNPKWIAPIILISPYKSIGRVKFDFWLPFDKFKSLNKIKKINCPVKIFHGEKDALVKISHGKYIYNKINNKKYTPSWIKDADHKNIINFIDLEEIRNIIEYK